MSNQWSSASVDRVVTPQIKMAYLPAKSFEEGRVLSMWVGEFLFLNLFLCMVRERVSIFFYLSL